MKPGRRWNLLLGTMGKSDITENSPADCDIGMEEGHR